MMTPTEIVAAYDILMKRALEVVGYVVDEHQARLHVKKNKFWLSWLSTRSDYDDWITDTEISAAFPLELLTLDDAAFAAWDADRKAAQEKAARAMARRRQAEQEMRERALLAQLQAKYRPVIS